MIRHRKKYVLLRTTIENKLKECDNLCLRGLLRLRALNKKFLAKTGKQVGIIQVFVGMTVLAFISNISSLNTVQAAFSDVGVTHPYFHGIEFLRQEGIVKGFKKEQQTVFWPREIINRVEALKMILLSGDREIYKAENSPFADVKTTDWFFPYVQTAYDEKIVKGFADGKFHPGVKVNRAEFIKMLIATFELEVPKKEKGQPWYAPYFELVQEYRILPKDGSEVEFLSRGEAAEIIYRMIRVAKKDFQGPYLYSGFGKASYYNEGFAGKLTASGEKYDPFDLTAAHRTLPFGTRLRVCNIREEDKCVVVRINDRGPYHQSRILDLSEGAFSRLATISTGVITVDFEIFSDPRDKAHAIPETLRPALNQASKEIVVPTEFTKLLHPDNRPIDPEKETTSKKQSELISQAYFRGETIGLIGETFFPNVKLRQKISQKMPKGLVMILSGSSTNTEKKYKRVRVFLQNKSTAKQVVFEGAVEGNNFSLPIAFMDDGKYNLGIVFDNSRESKVAEIEVVKPLPERKFPEQDIEFKSTFNLSLIPEEKIVSASWDSQKQRLTKFVYRQNKTKKAENVFENGINHFDFSYDFFRRFDPQDGILSIDVYQANSKDGSLAKQFTNWKKVDWENYQLVEGFNDMEKESISIPNFKRYHRMLKTVKLKGKVLEKDIKLADFGFVTMPNGLVKKIPLVFKNGDFYLVYHPEEKGKHIIELVANDGEILFNRAIYFNLFSVLPVESETELVVNQQNHISVYAWINKLRDNYNKSPLRSDVHLRKVAQEYAEKMANENFISHTDLEGKTLKDRMKNSNALAFGENLSYGTTLNLALSGLAHSGSHRLNILSERWGKMGVGVAQNEVGEFYVVQIFAK